MITKDFIITKDLCTYSIIFLRQEIILRDHEAGGGRPVTSAVGAADVAGDPRLLPLFLLR
jgi:hypothetical protein